jgi:hypothetical protein
VAGLKRHRIISDCNSVFAEEKEMAKLLALLLAFSVSVPGSIRHLDAQTINGADGVQPQSQMAAVNGIQHIIWVWFENREVTAITSATAPYFTSFAAANVNLTNFYGVTHPSQPNYLDAFSGSNQGVTNDSHFTFPASTNNLAKQLAAAGKSWRVYAQNFPSPCFDGNSSTGGVDGPGLPGQYVRKHNPAISFESVRFDATQCAYIQPLANFDPTVNFAMVVPNMTNDMHDGTTAQGDAFLQAFVPLVTASPDWDHTLLIVTFDEGTTSVNGGGHVYTAAAAPWLAHANVATTYNHFSVLRTIEEVYGLPFLGSAATATTMTELLPPTATPTPTPTSTPTCCMYTGTIATSCQYNPTGGLYDININAVINNPCGQTQTQAANFYLEGSIDGNSFEFIARTSIQNYTFEPGQNTIDESFLNQSIPEQYQYYRVRIQFYSCGIYLIYSPAAPVCRPGSTPTPTPTPVGTPTPTPPPTPTPTPTPIDISGTISYCSNPVPGPVPNVTLNLTGSVSGSALSDGSGNYLFASLPSGGSYTITPTKAARTPGSNNIDTVDVIATQRHFLNLGIPLTGCRLTAADVNGDSSVDTVDVIAIQRFFLGNTTGIANVGKYQFTPANRTYAGIVSNQTGQNYDTLVFGDVASPFAE